MPICKQCGRYFPYAKVIDGKRRDLNGRARCLECFPWGARIRRENIKNGLHCTICEKELINDQTVFCSSRCKSKQGYKNWRSKHPRVIRILQTEEDKLEYKRNYARKIYEERDRVFGTRCFFCNHEKYLDLHRKSGEKHQSNLEWIKRAIEEPNEWVRLCNKCHTGVHFCMDVLKMDWDSIIERLKYVNNQL